MFEEDQGLINTEINLYIQLGRTSELIGKLGEAIEIDPENDLLYFNRGTIYDQEGDMDNAIKDYKAAIDINPSSFGTNYNLGALYFNTAIEINNSFNNQVQSKVIISHVQDDIKQNQSTAYVFSKRDIFDGQISMVSGNHHLTGGLYISDEEASSFAWGSGFKKDTQSNAIFIQDNITEGNHRVFIAARLTDHETFGAETAWNAEYGLNINDQWSINASAGHAFRAPDATDRYGYGGNINLKPEASDDLQFNAAYRPNDNLTYRIELFDTQIENLIEYDFAKDKMLNIGEVSMRGMQLSYKFINEKYSIRADYISQKAKNDINKTLLLRRPKQSFTPVSYTHLTLPTTPYV